MLARFHLQLLIPFLTLLGTCFSAKGSDNIRFDNFTIREGLSQSTVNCLIQDQQGFIWVGTQDGLNKFNGYEFTVFKHDPQDSTSLTNNYIHDLYEDHHGDLWIATDRGISVFNRDKKRFRNYQKKDGLPHGVVWNIEGDGEGTIYAGTAKGGLAVIHPEKDSMTVLRRNEKNNSLPGNSIRSLYMDEHTGLLWIGTAGNGLALLDTGTMTLKTKENGQGSQFLPGEMIWTIEREQDRENFWIGTNNGLYKLKGAEEPVLKEQIEASSSDDPQGLSNNVVSAIHAGKNGHLWIGTSGGGLNKMVRKKNGKREFFHYTHSSFDKSSLTSDLVHTLLKDRMGSLWIGTNRGISEFDPGKQKFEHIKYRVTEEGGLNDQNVWSIFESGDSILWVGTREGLNRIDREKDRFWYYSRDAKNLNEINDNSVLSIYIEKNGRIWVGMVDGLFRLKTTANLGSARFERVQYRKNKAGKTENNKVYAIEKDRSGTLWIGTREGLSRYDPNTGEFRFFQHRAGDPMSLSNNVVRDIHQDREGRIWVATDGGGLNKVLRDTSKSGGKRIRFKSYHHDPSDPHSLSTEMIISIWEGQNGSLWLGTYGGGLNRFDPGSGEVKRYTEKDGLANNVVYGVLGDAENNLWMSTNHGISRLNTRKGSFQNYVAQDGLQSNEFNTGAFHKSASGELFFGGIKGVNAFYPENIEPNTIPPNMVLTKLLLHNETIRVNESSLLDSSITTKERLELAHDQDNLTLGYAALHYSHSPRNKYKYILEGFDKDTVYAGHRRIAHYTNLDPGTYHFKVFGTNSDGVWSEEPAELTILISPPFWATWWFRGLALLFFIGVGFGIYRYRVNIVEEQKKVLAWKVWERTREATKQKEKIQEQNKQLEQEKQKVEEQKNLLQEEKSKVDKLLVNVLPEDTANELKTGGKASARHYKRGSVMFTDFKNFTNIAESVKPTELVTRLDSYFIQFDKIIEKWELEKIKTIGDSYMCAGGIPIRNKTNPVHTVLAALEIQHYMNDVNQKLKDKGEEPWELRIGIHTGELIAGVIGIKRFAYDIWGDTVNVASRMESSSVPGKVNISGETFRFIEPFFNCHYRGKVPAKNKGQIDMYFVERIKPELSKDEAGIEPDQSFWDYVNLHFFSKINYKKAERYLLRLLREKLPGDLYYHDIDHTKDVCAAAERLALMEGITDEDLFLLKTAALYHDAGFIEQYDNNEPIGIRLAQEALPNFGYTEEQVEVISRLIRATEVPHDPQDHLEEIICDADLDYLGRDDFHERADTLKKELMDRNRIQSDKEWDEIQLKFLNQHRYFTHSARKLRQAKKEKHIREIEERLNQYDMA